MASDETKVFNPPNSLKNKVGVGGPDAVDAETLQKAEQAIANMTGNYLEWVDSDLTKLSTVIEDLLSDDGSARKEKLDAVFFVAHDMKGQGGSFNYRLITIIGDGLCRAIEKMKGDMISVENEVIKVHLEAMKLVIAKRMDGDGGKEGEALVAGLRSVTAKIE